MVLSGEITVAQRMIAAFQKSGVFKEIYKMIKNLFACRGNLLAQETAPSYAN